MKYSLILGLVAAVSLPLLPACDDGGTVSEEDLQYLRAREKLARDVYLTLYDEWQLTPHQNIAESEQKHMDRVKAILDSLDIKDPVSDDSVGAFSNTELAQLYTDLVATGQQSEVASLEVGATIEDLDINDIEEMKTRTDDGKVLNMYSSLQCGSRNHLRTFTSELSALGVTYSPRYISQAEFDDIISRQQETCGN